MDDGKVNVLSPAMLAELNAALDRAEADRAVVLLTGRPGVFSAGFDLAVLQGRGDEAGTMVRAGSSWRERLLSFPRPVVDRVHRARDRDGVFLLLSGDYRLGADGRLQDHRERGGDRARRSRGRDRDLPAAADAGALPARALLLAEVFSPADAVGGGFLDRVVPADELAGAAHSLAAGLAGLDPDGTRGQQAARCGPACCPRCGTPSTAGAARSGT